MKKLNLTKYQKERVKCFISALRSDKYKQTFNSLRDTNGFCAEGVMCDVYRARTKKRGVAWKNRGDIYQFVDENDRVQSMFAPSSALEYFGLDGLNLVDLNDNKKYSFKKIASLLEKKIA